MNFIKYVWSWKTNMKKNTPIYAKSIRIMKKARENGFKCELDTIQGKEEEYKLVINCKEV